MDTKQIALGIFNTLLVFGLSTSNNFNINDTKAINGLHAEDIEPEPIDLSLMEDELFKDRLESISSAIPMEFNQLVKKNVNAYIHRKESTERLIGTTQLYKPMFSRWLVEEGVPSEIAYLPIIESEVKIDALSHAGAYGMWQFMKGTAEIFDLRIDSFIDERRDPEKATQAAARYFKHLHGIYDDWVLALAAYNCGPGNVNKAIRRAGGKKDYWEIRRFLPKETRYYVPKFIAANYIMNFYDFHGLTPTFSGVDFSFDYYVTVENNTSIEQLTADLNVSEHSFKELNPFLLTDVIPGDLYPVKVKIPYPLYKEPKELIEPIDELDVPALDTFSKLETLFPSKLTTETLKHDLAMEVNYN